MMDHVINVQTMKGCLEQVLIECKDNNVLQMRVKKEKS